MSATIPPIAYCNFSRDNFVPSKSSVSKCCFLVLLTFCIIFMNLLMIAVLHSPNHHRFLKRQPRYFMTSLAITDLAFGTLVTPFSIFSSLYSCWPLGSIACVVEALLMGSLFHQSALSLMCVAVDRYICIVHPLRYHTVMTTKVCFTIIALSWITSFTIYSILVYPRYSRYTFDAVAFLTCEPYYGTKWITISLVTLFYIPPVLVISFCYLTVFFVAQKQFQRMKSVAITSTSCDENPIRPSKHALNLLVTKRGRGRPPSTWMTTVEEDLKEAKLDANMAQSPVQWKRGTRKADLQVCFTMIALSWITSFTIHFILVYPRYSRYTFDAVAFLKCEPYYGTKLITISFASVFYIPPVSVISFCYLTIFFVVQKQFQRMKIVAITSTSCDENPIRPSKMMSKELLKKYQTTFCLAFMAFGFAVVLTPWTLLAIISYCINIQVTEHVLFAVTWTGFSNCFWNPVIYGAMNKSFRDVASEVLSNALCVKKWKKICRSENTSPLSQFDSFT